ncbi:unnamed protein product [Rhizophagus irregularis]|uniref:FAR1 domain-containing protein n=1 Tax=Rhizophagus irregularis TaxID=588596 RepID=A0A915ZJD2_9GLOM|nr:unnamed protein product [Rhizophagus irregularis]
MNSEIVLNNTYQDDTYEIKFQVGDSFDDWNSIHIAVEAYAKQQGFVTNKYRKDLDSIDKSIIRHQKYVCKINCPWHVNFYFEKYASTIKLTQLSDYHNHQCNSEIIDLAPKNLKLPHAILRADQQYDLLTKKFPEHYIKKKNLYNAISKFRGVQIHNEFDAGEMLSYLLK